MTSMLRSVDRLGQGICNYFKGVKMETKRELNDILINDDDLQRENKTKKLMMMIAMALVFLCIVIGVSIFFASEDTTHEKHTAANNGLTPIRDPLDSSFENVPLGNNPSGEIDEFQQILDDIRKREQGGTHPQIAQNTQPTPQSPQPAPTPKPAQNPQPAQAPKPAAQPVLPAKPTAQPTPKPAAQPAKPPQNPTTPTKPTAPAKPASTNQKSIPNIFEDVSTPRMDTSKNGQVAEKGFYVQVGSFANKPSAEFLKQISNYSYRVYAGTSNGQPTTKYLIGPYTSRTEASRDLPNFKTLVPDPVHFEVK